MFVGFFPGCGFTVDFGVILNYVGLFKAKMSKVMAMCTNTCNLIAKKIITDFLQTYAISCVIACFCFVYKPVIFGV